MPNSYLDYPSVEEACKAKWAEGQKEYGPVFVGDPIEQYAEEQLDAINYLWELRRRGWISYQEAAVLEAAHITAFERSQAWWQQKDTLPVEEAQDTAEADV